MVSGGLVGQGHGLTLACRRLRPVSARISLASGLVRIGAVGLFWGDPSRGDYQGCLGHRAPVANPKLVTAVGSF